MSYEIAKEDCKQTCEIVGYNFQPDFMKMCKQIEECDVLEWNEELNACEVIEEGKTISYPIACRDIPAY